MKNKLIEHLKFADKIAQLSKDNSTKVGAAFFDKLDTYAIIFGYNGMPRGMDDKDPKKNERPEKYQWFEHAERNGIYNAAQEFFENIDAVAFVSHYPTMEGARALVSSGVKKVVFLKSNNPVDERAKELFSLCKIKTIEVSFSDKEIHGISDRMLEKYKVYLDLALSFGQSDSHELSPVKSGIMIVNEATFTPIASGASRPPVGLNVDVDKFTEENSQLWIQEPEKDAIFNLVRPKLTDSHAYVSWCPCARCSMAIASVKSSEVITKKPDFTQEADRRWKSDFERTQELFDILQIPLITITKEELEYKVALGQAKKKSF